MRSSSSAPDRQAFDPLGPGPAGFTHRGLHDGATFIENSLLAFAAALEDGAGIECDLRLTADDQVIVFHDADALRLCGSPATIARSTLADLARFTVGNHPIPTLQRLLELVDGRVPLLLEAKVDDDVWRFGPALLAALCASRPCRRSPVRDHDRRERHPAPGKHCRAGSCRRGGRKTGTGPASATGNRGRGRRGWGWLASLRAEVAGGVPGVYDQTAGASAARRKPARRARGRAANTG